MADYSQAHLTNQEREILIALRRIIRATDFSSKEIGEATGLATSQVLVLQLLEAEGPLTAGRLANELLFSKSTITAVLDGLEERKLIRRMRDERDRRSVIVSLTDSGREVLASAPMPLQAQLLLRFRALPDWERSWLLAALQRVCHLLGATKIEASPVLDVGAIGPGTKPERS
ncbi:MAG TPA: MarR family transcriptional regulator [Alphaproteobacteria bacterium]|nr:MarR family transcriptional regulator [Alphaproteobacteria bacterium]